MKDMLKRKFAYIEESTGKLFVKYARDKDGVSSLLIIPKEGLPGWQLLYDDLDLEGAPFIAFGSTWNSAKMKIMKEIKRARARAKGQRGPR